MHSKRKRSFERPMHRIRWRGSLKSKILYVICMGIEGREARTKSIILPGEGPSDASRCNYDTLSSK